MNSDFNPFPDYPVISLDDDANVVRGQTVATPAIREARIITQKFLDMWGSDGRAPLEISQPFIVAVRGDYGSGKTHLLLDVASTVAEHQKNAAPWPAEITLLVPCIETDPIAWYQTTVVPRLDIANVQDAVVLLYAEAGRNVAKQVNLTQAAVQRLRREPSAIHELVKEDLLNASAVEEEFTNLLAVACKNASQNVRAALCGLLWSETATLSIRWLKGEPLSSTHQNAIGVSSDLSTDEGVTDVLVALAGLFTHIGRRFVFMIDELEHFTRHHEARGTKRNLTWLKRLLESLADFPVLVFVSGHWSAWEATSDYLDRFTPDSMIDIHSMEYEDVLQIFTARLLPDFDLDPKVAKAIARFGDGNIRRILSLARVLYDESHGFSEPVSEKLVQETARRISQRISPQDAILNIHETLESHGLSVQRNSLVAQGAKFDLAGYRGDEPNVVVELKHSVNQRTLIKHLKRFTEKLQEVRRSHPDLIGFFVSDGAGDPKLRAILESDESAYIHFVDLATPSGLAELTEKVDRLVLGDKFSGQQVERMKSLLDERDLLDQKLTAAQETRGAELMEKVEEERAQIKRERAQIIRETRKNRSELDLRHTELQKQISHLEERRSKEFEQLQERLAQMAEQFSSARTGTLVAPQEEETGPRIHVTYEDLKRPPSLSARLRILLRGPGALLVAFGTILIIVYSLGVESMLDLLSRRVGPYFEILLLYRGLAYFFMVAFIFLGIWWLWRGWVRMERFFDFRARIIRDTYLRSEEIEDLLKVDQILQSSLEDVSPLDAIKKAKSTLAKRMPEIFEELRD